MEGLGRGIRSSESVKSIFPRDPTSKEVRLSAEKVTMLPNVFAMTRVR